VGGRARRDRPRHARTAGARDEPGAALVEPGVGHDDDERRRFGDGRPRRLAAPQQVGGAREVVPGPDAGEHRPVGVEDVAERVDRRERRDGRVAGARRGRAEAALRPAPGPAQLPDRAARADADAPPLDLRARGLAGGPRRGCVRADGAVADDQVVDDGGEDERHQAAGRRVADAALGEMGHDPVGRAEAERAAAGEEHGVDAGRVRGRREQLALTRAGTAAAHLRGRDRALRQEDHGAARPGVPV
jgi:hypothetical protein